MAVFAFPKSTFLFLGSPKGARPALPAGTGADFSSASSDFKALGAFFCNFVILSVRQREPRTVSCLPVYHILWVRGLRAHTISGRGFNLFKLLRRHFRATPFCRQTLSRRDPGDRRLGVTQHFAFKSASVQSTLLMEIVISPLAFRTPPEQAARPADPPGAAGTTYTHGNMNFV